MSPSTSSTAPIPEKSQPYAAAAAAAISPATAVDSGKASQAVESQPQSSAASDSKPVGANVAAPAKAPAVSPWKVPSQEAVSGEKSSLDADPNSWPDPATAAAASDATAPPQGHQQSAKQQQAKRGKGKWVPLETEIQYSRPKNAVQQPPTQRHQKQQQQQSLTSSAKDADASGAKGTRSSGAAHKKQNRSDSIPSQSNHANGNTATTSGAHNQSHQQHESQQHQQQQQQQGRSQRTPGRGRGRGRGSYNNASNGRRNGPRTVGHAPSHYQGKGNVQAGNFVPMPIPQPASDDEQSISSFVRAQVEYYFSVDNLCKDIFFRSHMDTNGFVPLSLLADFNRIKAVTTDIDLVRSALGDSEKVELNEAGNQARKRGDWATWVFPKPEVVQQQKQKQSDALKSE
ncbi:hypothetical protein LPJ53_001083 [Coemansia erecta]|uniref:HTH La-type RNA-binding domain-containing protein n=1 Tax=Coemansia erecta TaxID=147472 RepID=A0A9W7Y4Q6_9FUNG|nr:hypothetical protein LPJ53_001083 [Coemansia erecta]